MPPKPVDPARVDAQLAVIRQGTVEIIPEADLRRKLERSLAAGEPLVVKQGFDPTAPDIHLGHTVGLGKLRQIQDLGHKVVVLTDDFPGMIGDPSGRHETRKRLDHEVLIENAKTYTGASVQDSSIPRKRRSTTTAAGWPNSSSPTCCV
jgi:tyrosyl-tRNA synthetase